MRASGILLPIFSLPSNYGIGCFSKEAYDFIDKLKIAGQSYWQILPLGSTGYGDSPYQSFSTFAGNPYFIDLEALISQGLLDREECECCDFGTNTTYIDYDKLYQNRYPLLKKAYYRSDLKQNLKFQSFLQENAYWLDNYSLFMAIKDHFQGSSWDKWEEDIRFRKPNAIEKYRLQCQETIQFYQFLQFLFFQQWNSLHEYAASQGIQIIGDIPIYVAFDSADCWANKELFQFDQTGQPTAVAGCPPDAFSSTGQLWGNPLYNWDYHKTTSYVWWINRISYSLKLYDVVRIDHFRGFDEYYSIPFGDITAEHGSWKKGPGYDIFQVLSEKLGSLNIIAEDLGYLTESVKSLLKATHYPGMKILQFAFDSREESDYQPHTYSTNCVVYTGTHDNDTIKGWYDHLKLEDKLLALEYLGIEQKAEPYTNLYWSFIRLALSSVAKLAIIPIQDYLELDSKARINTPSTLGNNWKWRLESGALTEELLSKIYNIIKLYGRN